MLEMEVYIQPWKHLLPGTEGFWGPHKAAAPCLPGLSPRPSPPPPSPLQALHARLLLFVKRKPSGARTAVAGGPGPAAVLAGVTGTPASSPRGGPAAGLRCSCPAVGAATKPGHLRACPQPEEAAWHCGGAKGCPVLGTPDELP